MKILAGDWPDHPIRVKYDWSNKLKFIIFRKGFSKDEKIHVNHIVSMETVTEENKASVLGKAVWGIAGAALLGGVGLLARVLMGGRGKEVVVSVVLKDGRRALLQCKAKEHKELLAVGYGL